MDHVTSRDGTQIAYQRLGDGPSVIIIGGALSDHAGGQALAEQLADELTAIVYDRRSRRHSGDNSPGTDGAVDREVEDLAALVEMAGGRVMLIGGSSGGVLALAAAEHGLPVERLVLFEPPFATESFPPVAPPDMPEQLTTLLDRGPAGDVVELFLTRAVGLPSATVEQMKGSPAWAPLQELAPSTVYDAMLTRTFPYPDAFATVTVPTLVLTGQSTFPLLVASAEELARVLPNAEYRTITGSDHTLDPAAAAAAIRAFVARTPRPV